MRLKVTIYVISFIIFFVLPIYSQAILQADGPDSTYELINSVLAPGYNVVENPECVHPEFGRHIVEVWDTVLNKYVFEFYSHVTPDNDRCIVFDRQRIEIKTYDQSPDNLKGVIGETITYKWKFKLPVGFQPSSNFTHIHQIKPVGGDDGNPLFTLTPRKGSPNKMELIHNNTDKVVIVNLSLFEGVWVECTEVVKVGSAGTYSMVIKKVSDGTTLLSYSNNSLMTIRSDNNFIRPKWGIYRSKLDSTSLRDEAMRFADFYIAEETTTSLPNPPTSLSAVVVSATQINLFWIDNSTNEENFRIERSTNGSTWLDVASAQPNATSYSDTVLDSSIPYYYRVRSENTFGNSAYSNTVYSISGQLASVNSGDWGVGTTWVGGMVPGAADNVVIGAGHSVTLNVLNAFCNNLTIDGKLRFAIDGTVTGITVNGNITVNSGGLLRVETRNPAGAANSFVEHFLNLKGNLTNNGTVDFRGGSNAAGTANGVLLTLNGSSNSTISLTGTTYQSSIEEFNGITINKTGGAKVILQGGNLFMSNNSTTGPVVMTLTQGIVETGMNHWVVLATGSTAVTGGSSNSYVNGFLGRGMSNSGTADRLFEIGDGNEFRPIKIHSTTSGVATGHYVWAKVIDGNANTGGSTLLNGIDRVSSLRYYQFGYATAISGPAAFMKFDLFTLSYRPDDGVLTGNTDLRVAYSVDSRITWNGINQSIPHITDLTLPPTFIAPDTLVTAMQIDAGNSMLISLANATGGVNPLAIPKSLTLTALIEGFYDGTTVVSDTVIVELRNAFSPFGLVEQATTVLSTLGAGTANFFSAADATNYYVALKHRNSVETWSASGQSFTGGTMNYNFTTGSGQAYGSNMVLKGSSWCIYSGDVNQDGVVDLTDVATVDIDNLNFVFGYTVTDVNGDNLVDISDLSIVDTNNLNFVSKVVPSILLTKDGKILIQDNKTNGIK